jgi:FtsP/CotA-like multicopper oxidase with cupredoxin domain
MPKTLVYGAILLTLATSSWAQAVLVSEPPQVSSHNHVVFLTLHAVNVKGRDAFVFDDKPIPPIIRAFPGDVLKITYVNDLPLRSPTTCAINPCTDMTNLHFHGLTVSPNSPQDDVLGMMALPGQVLHYSVQIPRDHEPGLFWYHTHPHGESHRQVLDGMSGAIVIEGIERYAPEVRQLPERVMIVRGLSLESDPKAEALKQKVGIPTAKCGSGSGTPNEIFTVNGEIRPGVEIAPGERQFWRIVNASADRYLDLQVDQSRFEVIALDGMPLAYHDPKNPRFIANHLLVAPAGRLEAVVTGPPPGAHAALRTLCVDTGADGDPNPEMVLADLVLSVPRSRAVTRVQLNVDKRPPLYKPVDLETLKNTAPSFKVIFTEDKNGFYINGQKFSADAAPMMKVRVGTYQHWLVVNQSGELHPFHIHQVHFLAYRENGVPLAHPTWLDTVNVPYRGSVDVLLDFTDPVIRGMSVFHCHLLNHEDKGMMAKVLFR